MQHKNDDRNHTLALLALGDDNSPISFVELVCKSSKGLGLRVQTVETLRLLCDFAAQPFFLQRREYFLVVKVSGHLERLCPFGRRLLLYTSNRFCRSIHRFDAFATAKVDPFDLERLRLFTFGSASAIQFNIGIT